MKAPRDCYIHHHDNVRYKDYEMLFAFVDFGSKSNKFLKKCKTKADLSIDDIANAILENPGPSKCLEIVGVAGFVLYFIIIEPA